MDLLNQFGKPLSPAAEAPAILGAPAMIVPQEFSLARMDTGDLEKIRDEVMDKEKQWESNLNQFWYEFREYAESWRIQSRSPVSKRPTGLFNSKSGETHRGTETLATLWFRELTASDSFYEAVRQGLGPDGNELTEEDLYSVEKVILTQLRWLHFKPKLLRSLRSLALFGTIIFEQPWVVMPSGNGEHFFEGTDLNHRSLLQTGFDTTVFDLEQSDFIFTVDYPTVWRLREWARSSPEIWDKSAIEGQLQDASYGPNGNSLKTNTGVYQRLQDRKQRAGYSVLDKNIRELISYHGKLDTNNSVVQAYCESLGRDDDPQSSDFTVGILDGQKTVRI